MKILVIDDNSYTRHILKIHLENASHVVIESPDGEKGLQLAENENPDIIITDLIMPEMDGFEFIELLRKNDKINDIPILVLTVDTAKEDNEKAIRMGANDYMVKPFQPETLLKKIDELIQ